MTTAYFDQFNRAPEGPDVFSVSQAREIEETGQAPADFNLPRLEILFGGDWRGYRAPWRYA